MTSDTESMMPDGMGGIFNTPVLFGLKAQGHIPTIERMLSEGKSWTQIGAAIGWCPKTAEEHYSWHLQEIPRC